MENRLFIRKVLGSYILHKLEDNVLTILGDSQHTIGGIEPFYKISHKNCEAIENGYDLDELAKEHLGNPTEEELNKESAFGYALYKSNLLAFKKGCQIILEILEDRKFSELDKKLDSMVHFAKNHFTTEAFKTIQMFVENLKANVQKIQQPSEWDVEIEMRPASLVYKTDEMLPKLDSDGYIILTLKK